jgi:hypothetical protein
MDPTAALVTIRNLIAEIEATGSDRYLALSQLADSLAEHVKALDQWMTRGGFLPRQWRPE